MRTAVDIYSPDVYVSGPPHETFAELRRTQPVFWQEIPGEPGYWAVLKHADVMHVSRHPEIFSSNAEGVVLENLQPDQLEMMRLMVLAMDPPRHAEVRRPLNAGFNARAVAGLESRVRAICRDILNGIDGEIEFVHTVAAELPSRVVGGLMGLPREDWPLLRTLSERVTGSQDADAGGADFNAAAKASVEMAVYAIDLAARRRKEPAGDDLTAMILAESFGGVAMTDADFGSFFVQLVAAANDTTKTMLSSGVHALLEHPEALTELRADPGLIPGAVEEILRWANPLHYFRRTATADTDLRGTRILAGDKVALYYTSANRDEDVFADPQRFDIGRSPNPHLAFGAGEHFCLGAHLARLEGRVFFEELLGAFQTIELAGAPIRLRSNLNNSLKSLPIRMGR